MEAKISSFIVYTSLFFGLGKYSKRGIGQSHQLIIVTQTVDLSVFKLDLTLGLDKKISKKQDLRCAMFDVSRNHFFSYRRVSTLYKPWAS